LPLQVWRGRSGPGQAERATGGVYTDDLQLPGACHVHFVRSAVAHARIRSVDVSAALDAPGVVTAYTGAVLADLPGLAPPMPMINAASR
jgi:aerobic carbon-monoxide dehydrogenase large subunit